MILICVLCFLSNHHNDVKLYRSKCSKITYHWQKLFFAEVIQTLIDLHKEKKLMEVLYPKLQVLLPVSNLHLSKNFLGEKYLQIQTSIPKKMRVFSSSKKK